MKEKLISKLNDLNYQYDPETDDALIEFTLCAVENKIKNRINADTIPDGLKEVEIEMVCGEFLKLKKTLGQLADYDFEATVETIKEGDTSITFKSDTTAEQRFDAMINAMINGHEEDFIRYRKLVW